MTQLALYEMAAFVASLAAIAAYQLFLSSRVRRNPRYSIQALNAAGRQAWVENVIRGRHDLLAVQTLRNSIMVAVFLASTSVLLIIGVLTLTGQSDKLGAAWHALSVLGTAPPELWLFKLLVMLLDLIYAFFSFVIAMRLFNHVGYLINVAGNGSADLSTQHVAAMLNRAGRHHSRGVRAYWLLVPLLLWLFGPAFLMAATAGIIVVLWLLDRAPDGG